MWTGWSKNSVKAVVKIWLQKLQRRKRSILNEITYVLLLKPLPFTHCISKKIEQN